jgi:hypothetical protein
VATILIANLQRALHSFFVFSLRAPSVYAQVIITELKFVHQGTQTEDVEIHPVGFGAHLQAPSFKFRLISGLGIGESGGMQPPADPGEIRYQVLGHSIYGHL